MAIQTFREWPDARRRDAYPFRDGASLTSTNGELQLDRQWFLDGRLWPDVSDGRVYLRQIEVQDQQLILTLRDRRRNLGRAVIGYANERAVFYDRGVQIGFLQLEQGAAQAVAEVGVGTYVFSANGTELAPTVVTPRVVSGLESVGAGGQQLDSQQIRIVGGDGVELTPDGGAFRINVVGDDLYRRDQCEVPEVLGRRMHPVRRIRWRDQSSGAEGLLTPLRGRVVVGIVENEGETTEDRGYRAPGPNRELIDRIR